MCYEAGLRTDSSISGRIELEIAITQEGLVSSAGYHHTDLPPDVAECMARWSTRLTFPPPSEKRVDVLYPMFFSPGM